MKKSKQALVLMLLLTLLLTACAAKAPTAQKMLVDTHNYLLKAAPQPSCGAVGGDWVVMGMARSGLSVPDGYFEDYYRQVEQLAKECEGVLSDRKYTEYARIVLALTAIGKDPRTIAGYDLLTPLSDFEAVKSQGINGPIFALIALDSGAYEMPSAPAGKVQATREAYVNVILDSASLGGGWAFGGGEAEPDMTAMALQALAKYREQPEVQTAIDAGLSALSDMQNDNGGFVSWNADNSESVSQVLTALCALDISEDDPRFVKNGKTLIDALVQFQCKDGGFSHTLDAGKPDQMATEQAFYALAALERRESGKTGLYDMTDVEGQ